jgi:SAM-dependent methyltransferase
MTKQRAISVLRRSGLLGAADAIRGRWHAFRARPTRRVFEQKFGAPLPPDDLAYDAYANLDWQEYWEVGSTAAGFVASIVGAAANPGRLLEWGCGPARIIRHLPALLPGWTIHGADVNAETVRWCAANIEGVTFVENGPAPPLPFADGSLDAVYAVSVFTHLSRDMHRRWAAELRRVLRAGGLLVCTLHGQTTRDLLDDDERAAFDAGRLVVRGRVTEGTRCFLAYHPERFVREELLQGFANVERHAAGTHPCGLHDLWIARRA